MEEPKLDLSIVIPVFNEESNLEPLHREIESVLSGQGLTYEILAVDDGSTDGSFETLQKIQKTEPHLRIIRFRRNFGQTAALSAGFKHARGRVIVPMDADGQNDPADIPRLLKKLQEGYDIVSGWRKERKDNPVTRTLPSRIANWLIGRITGVRLHDYGCTLKAYRAESLKPIRLYGEMHRFIPALARWGGEKVAEVVVNHRPRRHGKTKYGLNRIFKVLLDLITIKFLASFSTKPIYVFGGLGMVCLLGSIVSGAVVLYMKLALQYSMNRNPLLIVSLILMTTAVQFVLMGLLAEILVRTYHESQDRPTYVIERILEPAESAGEDKG
ncbi:MAG TPA: glycosyltransferase family 2 protein [Anaerohalosphaeraceae bacterium]|nr:glycosyltransferase family 2 protein [Anaerohalosphaeraceae bacterium]HOL88542.1 glycosyltransferase family 2 protein [Anaerohalosphaeraceae bacterium]HPP56404.1 glycosyltransferase family 2 protein [Anaerohalosphaeraceae bacterium]